MSGTQSRTQYRKRVEFAAARAQFPVLERLAYLNAGTFGPLARTTAEALELYRRRDLEEGRSGPGYWESLMEGRERLRARLAAMLHVTPEQVALTGSTTDGCNVVLGGLGLGPDDEVVTTDVEHPGLLGPLHASGAAIRVAWIKERPADEAFDAILAEVTPRTQAARALARRLVDRERPADRRAEGRRPGLPILVDGAQSVGAIDVDATAFDYYTVSGQKWLCGPEGTGALVRGRSRAAPGRRADLVRFVHDVRARRASAEAGRGALRRGWVGPGQVAGLEAALAAAPEWRFERALEQARRARERLAEVADVVTAPAQATLVTFRCEGDTAETAKRIAEQGVVIRDLPGTGWLRASVGWWTSDEDVERLVAAL